MHVMYPAFVKSFCKVEIINLMILLNYYLLQIILQAGNIWWKATGCLTFVWALDLYELP